MENASKALIIAGSIILSVLIITLGMYFYSQSAGLGKTFSMTEYEIQQHNSTFQSYEGKITGAEARELYDVVYQFNLSSGEDKAGVILHTGDPSNDLNSKDSIITGKEIIKDRWHADKSSLQLGKFYKVTMYKSEQYGIITNITISEIK